MDDSELQGQNLATAGVLLPASSDHNIEQIQNDAELGVSLHRKIRTLKDCERLINEAKTILEEVWQVLTSVDTETVTTWLKEIENLQAQCFNEIQKPIVVVIGTTGAGKSTLINAILGHEDLLPTNCVRACTAVITEVSWNHKPIGSPHRAKVMFLTPEEWRTEIEILLSDVLQSGRTISADITERGSESMIAFCKLKAVHPFLDKYNLSQITTDILMQIGHVQDVLGKEKVFASDTPKKLQAQIKRYVDSKEKRSVRTLLEVRPISSTEDFEYWPLVRKVSIYTRAAALQSGCVLVDLPGSADSNEARGSIWKSHVQHATAIFIASPETRAVDDGHARKLGGTVFKRQMHRDGALGRLTFVCTKSDDIDVSEAEKNFDHIPGFLEKLQALDKRTDEDKQKVSDIEQELLDLKAQLRVMNADIDRISIEENAYKGLRTLASSGQEVYPPILKQIKRPRAGHVRDQPGSKRLRPNTTTTSICHQPLNGVLSRPRESITSFAETVPAKSLPVLDQDRTQLALTLSDIATKVGGLKDKRQEIESDKDFLEADLEALESELGDLQRKIRHVDTGKWQACVTTRNTYVTDAIRADFADGIRDLHRTEAQEDDKNYDPNVVFSLDAVRIPSLPVFCVSARGYQALKRRGESQYPTGDASFNDVNETGIPALAEHIQNIGSIHLQAKTNQLVDDINRFLTALRAWSQNGSPQPLVGVRTEGERDAGTTLILGLLNGIQDTMDSTLSTITAGLIPRVLNQLMLAAPIASGSSLSISEKWGASAYRGGLHWATYKAVARRSGRHINQERTIDFNEDLTQPFVKEVDPIWHEVFNEEVSRSLDQCSQSLTEIVGSFRLAFAQTLVSQAVPDTTIVMFEEQTERLVRALVGKTKEAKHAAEAGQREANRLFVPSICASMLPIYPVIASEHEKGCHARMKEHMRNHLLQHRDTMFLELIQGVKDKIIDAAQTPLQKVLTQVLTSCDTFKNDCSIFSAQQPPAMGFAALEENAQKEILRILIKIGGSFGMADSLHRPSGGPIEVKTPDPGDNEVDDGYDSDDFLQTF